MIDPVAAFLDRNVSKGAVWAWRYALVGWLTAVYHVYSYPNKLASMEGLFFALSWPLYWFVETFRIVGGLT